MVRKYSIIDADAHVNPPPTFWKDYLPAHLRDLAPRIESGDDADYVVFEGKRKKFSVMSAQAGKKGEDYKFFGRQSDTRPHFLLRGPSAALCAAGNSPGSTPATVSPPCRLRPDPP